MDEENNYQKQRDALHTAYYAAIQALEEYKNSYDPRPESGVLRTYQKRVAAILHALELY